MKNFSACKFLSAILAGLISLLGFSCDTNASYDEYGAPNATYRAIGTVLDKETDEPVEGLNLQLFNADYYEDTYNKDYPFAEGKTDADGKFELEGHSYESGRFVLLLESDGTAATYFFKEIYFSYENVKFEGGKSWYKGTGTHDFGVIKLSNQPINMP